MNKDCIFNKRGEIVAFRNAKHDSGFLLKKCYY